MNVLLVEPMREPRAVQIESGLESLQKAVGESIEAIYPFDDPVALITNGEGKIDGLPLNRALRDEAGEIYDVMAGQFLVVGLGKENFSDLPPDMMEKYKKHFKNPEMFLRLGGRIVAVKCPVHEERKRKPAVRPLTNDAR